MTNIYLNGKFTAQRTTGVQRVAACLVQALDDRLASSSANWTLLCPAAGIAPPLRRIGVLHVGPASIGLHMWEQCVLPAVARGGLLVNLAGAAPYLARRQVCLLHDAAVFDHPEAYTRVFVAWYRLLFHRLARGAIKLLTVSEFSRARLAWHLRLPPGTPDVVPNGCDHLDAVAPDVSVLTEHQLSGTRYLLAVGSANPTKNLPALIAAYASLPPEPARRLVIVGGHNSRVFAKTAPAQLPGVVFTGPIDDAKLKALYQHATAFVFPSLYEGFGLPPLEAMACGCPVAAADGAAMVEVCGDAALYFDPRSPDAIAAALQRLLLDAPMRVRLRIAGLERAAVFRWRDSANRLHDHIVAAARTTSLKRAT